MYKKNRKGGKYNLWDRRSGIRPLHKDRDIDSGLYYDAYKGEWRKYVSKKDMKEEGGLCMYNFNCYDVEKIRSVFGESKVEKVGMFLSLVYERGMIEKYNSDGWKGVYFSTDELKRIIGDDWRKITGRLFNSGVLDIEKSVSKYRGDRKMHFFKLNEEFFSGLGYDITSVVIRDKRYEKSMRAYFNRNCEKRSGVLKKVEVTLDKCDLVIEDLDSLIDEVYRKRLNKDLVSLESEYIGNSEKDLILDKLSDLDAFEKDYKRDLRRLYNALVCILQKSIIEEKRSLYRISRDEFGGRLYHLFSNIPRDFRKKIKIDRKEVVEIDIKASQPSFLCLLFEKGSSLKMTKGIFDKYNNDQYIKIAKEYGMDLYRYMAIKLKGKRFENDSTVRVNMKQIFFQLVFGRPRSKVGDFKKKEICDILFGPEFYKFLSELALLDLGVGLSHKHKNLSYLLQKTECIFLNKLMDEMGHIPLLPIHDSLMVKKSDANKVKKLFKKTITDNKLEGFLSFS